MRRCVSVKMCFGSWVIRATQGHLANCNALWESSARGNLCINMMLS